MALSPTLTMVSRLFLCPCPCSMMLLPGLLCSQPHSSHCGFLSIPQPQKLKFAIPVTCFLLVSAAIPPHDPSLCILQFLPSFIILLLFWPGGRCSWLLVPGLQQKQYSGTAHLSSPCLHELPKIPQLTNGRAQTQSQSCPSPKPTCLRQL